jgi:hypothetical protein
MGPPSSSLFSDAISRVCWNLVKGLKDFDVVVNCVLCFRPSSIVGFVVLVDRMKTKRRTNVLSACHSSVAPKTGEDRRAAASSRVFFLQMKMWNVLASCLFFGRRGKPGEHTTVHSMAAHSSKTFLAGMALKSTNRPPVYDLS